ncbi:MAG: glycosyltransferase [Lachnospiraceae bacterium]
MTFSILIPCYNIAPYLKKCLESIMQQTYKDWEIIIVDDGSTDGTRDIIRYYATRDKRIKAVFQKENQGVAVTRNILLKEASGDYIIFLDGDDWWKGENGLAKIAAASQKNSMDIIVFQHETVDKNGCRVSKSNNIHLLEESMVYKGEDYLKMVLMGKDTYQWFPWLYAFKRKLWIENNIKFNTETYALEDAEILYLVILSAFKLVVLHEIIYQYRIEREGKLTQPSKKFLYSMLSFCVNNIKEVEKRGIDPDIKKLLCANFSSAYFRVLYSVNYLQRKDAQEVFHVLEKHRDVMNHTRKRKYKCLSKLIFIIGLRATSKLWFFLRPPKIVQKDERTNNTNPYSM